MLVLIFACTTTKTIHANPMGSPPTLPEESGKIILRDKDSLYLEKREGKWRLMECEDSLHCKEVKDVNSIARHLQNLQLPIEIENYCQEERENDLL